MLGILLLYWVGNKFYILAETHQKSPWGFAILGIAVYYFGILFFGFYLGVLIGLSAPSFLDNLNETFLGILTIPLGLLSSYLLYKYLEKIWGRNYSKAIDLVDEFDEFDTSDD